MNSKDLKAQMRNDKDSYHCMGLNGSMPMRVSSGLQSGRLLIPSLQGSINRCESGPVKSDSFGCFFPGVLAKQISAFHLQWREFQKVGSYLSQELVLISPEEYKPEKRLKV